MRRKKNKSPARSAANKHKKKNMTKARLDETPEKRRQRLDAVAESYRKGGMSEQSCQRILLAVTDYILLRLNKTCAIPSSSNTCI